MAIGYEKHPSFLALVELNIIYIMRHEISSRKGPFLRFSVIDRFLPLCYFMNKNCEHVNKSIHHEARPAFFLSELPFTVHRQIGTAFGRIYCR